MRVLVTGGAGFIGSHIVDALAGRGHEVAIVDNLSTGLAQNINPQARFYQTDICSGELTRIFEEYRPEIVSHQAAQTVVTRSVADPVYDAHMNILGSLNLLGHAARFGVKKFIYASSGGATYGEPRYLPVDEDHPVSPLSPYGASKHAVEHYLQIYRMQHNLNYVVLRYPNVYGPRQNPKAEAGVVAIFAGLMLRGEQPTIYGTGDKTRDYTNVSDIVSANLLSMTQGEGQTYNIGTGVETSDQEMFDILAGLLGYRGKPVYAPLRGGEVRRIALNATKAQKELGWQPGLSLKEGLAQAIDYYRTLYR